MKMQGINNSINELFSNKGSRKYDKPLSSGNDFDRFMDKNLVSDGKGSTSKKSEISSPKNRSNPVQRDAIKDKNDYSTKSKDSMENIQIDEVDLDKVEMEQVDNSPCNEIIEKATKDIKDMIMNELLISEEELNELMEVMGLSMIDLLNTDIVKMLAVKTSGSDDILTLLTNENLFDSIQNVINFVKELRINLQLFNEDNINLKDNKDNSDNIIDVKNDFVEIADIEKNLKNEDLEQFESTLNLSKDITIQIESTSGNDLSSMSHDDQTGKSREEINKLPTVEDFIHNLSTVYNENNIDFVENMEHMKQIREITTQIVEQIKVQIKPDQVSMELQLNPENLGRVNLSIVSKDGVLTAQFTTQNEVAKEAIESQIQYLSDTLKEQGLRVESIEVALSSSAFEESSSQSTRDNDQPKRDNRRNIVIEDINSYSNLKEIDKLSETLVEVNENSVDYSA